jgi:hypothetical protein
MSGIHCYELGIWQYIQGNPQAGAGTAVGKCLTIRPVACERATPAMIHRPSLLILTSTCTKNLKVEVSLTPTLIPERTEDEGAAKQDHSPGTATKFLRTYRWCDS